MTSLRELPIGKTATIRSVGGEGALRQHFLDMGLIPKGDVTMVKYAPMGDPMELRIHSYELTLRLADAEKIEIENIRDAKETKQKPTPLQKKAAEAMPLSNNGVDESQIRFVVNKLKNVDDDEENSLRTELPFQIAYAVSIHKAQGLEYRSVKIVITDEVDELITHNIFYTAITRAREKLKIYWTPEVEQAVLERIKPKDIKKDVGILRKYINSQTQ